MAIVLYVANKFLPRRLLATINCENLTAVSIYWLFIPFLSEITFMPLHKCISLLIVSLTVASTSFSQQLYFPHGAYASHDNMNKALPELTLKVMDIYEKSSTADKVAYYASLFRYQVITNRFADALTSIDSIRWQFRGKDAVTEKTYAFPFWLYASVMKDISASGAAFETAFDRLFTNEYNGFSFKAADAAENYFKADLQGRQQRYLDILEKNKQIDRDSISYRDAQNLCFAYLNYVVYSAEIPRVKNLLKSITHAKYIIQDSLSITMRDGAQVSATIVRSRNITTPQPAVLKFGIYASESVVPEAKFIAEHGYAAVIADTRGKRLSKDKLEPFEHDASDAYDIIDWISKQTWCNGKVGMYGGSYLGFTQWAATKKMHPALKTIVPQVAVGIGIDVPYLNGIYWTDMLNWIHLVSNNKLTDWSHTGDKVQWDSVKYKWYTGGKSINTLDSIAGRPNNIFQRHLQHPSYDSYWNKMIPYRQEFSKIDIPILTITGYYDDDQRGAMYYFDQHHKYNKASNHYLLIGPYDHYGAQGYPLEPPAVLNGYTIDSVAQISIMDIVFGWFDHTLKGAAKPALLKDRINFEVMGASKWRHVPSLQKMNNDTLTLYLSSVPSGDHNRLLDKPILNDKPLNQKINLADKSNFSSKEIVINSDGAIVDSSLYTANSLCFKSDPFENPYEINGSFLINLNSIINKKDMDVSVKLYEQLPDGRYFQLSNNIARYSYVKNAEKRQLLTPGKVHNFSFSNTFFTSRRIQKGSRIVLLIGVNNSPDWEVNYGTGKEVSKESINDNSGPLLIQWLTSNSYIKLPVWK